MSRTALILAAHGSRHEHAVADMLREYADHIEAMRLFDEVATAFHQNEPSFSTVLDEIEADDVTIVPFFTSVGYYTTVVLPRELSRNRRFPDVRLRLTAPVGTHPGMVDLVAARVRDLFHTLRAEPPLNEPRAFSPQTTTLAVVGHGTERHRNSREATVALARRLAQLNLCAEVVSAFLDEEPLVESIPHRALKPNVIVIPFLIGEGPHAMRDLPKRLGIMESGGAGYGFASYVIHDDSASQSAGVNTGGMPVPRFVICDRPVGADPRTVDLTVDLAVGTRSEAQNWLSHRVAESESRSQISTAQQRLELTDAPTPNRNWKGSLTNRGHNLRFQTRRGLTLDAARKGQASAARCEDARPAPAETAGQGKSS